MTLLRLLKIKSKFKVYMESTTQDTQTFSGFAFLRSLDLKFYEHNQLALFQKVFDYADHYEDKAQRNQVVKSFLSSLNLNLLDIFKNTHSRHYFKIEDEMIDTLCQAYFNEQSSVGLDSNSVSLSTFIGSLSDARIITFLEKDSSYTATKASYLIEMYASFETQKENFKSFTGALYHVAKNTLNKWKEEKFDILSYALTEKLILRVSSESNSKRYKHLNTELFFSYTKKEHYDTLCEKYPHLIFDTNRSFLIKELIEQGYGKILQENSLLTRQKITQYLKEGMFLQAQQYLPFTELKIEDLVLVDEYFNSKYKENHNQHQFQKKRFDEFKLFLEQQYLNLKIESNENKEKINKVKVKI